MSLDNRASCQYRAQRLRGFDGLEYSYNRVFAMRALEEQLDGNRFGIRNLVIKRAANAGVSTATEPS